MKFTTIFLIGLLSIGAICQSDLLSLSQIDQHTFGSMILSTVSVHFSTEAPIEKTLELLNGVQKGLEKEQGAADKKNATDQARCESESARLRSEIANHKEIIANNKKNKETNEALLRDAEATLLETNSNIARNRKQFSEETALRAKQAAEFVVQQKDHKEAVAAVDGAVALISHLKSGSSFVQLEKHFQKTIVLLEKHRDSHPLYGPVIETLAQLGSKADQATVKKILDLFQRLKVALQKSLATDEATESQRLADWAKRSSDLQNEHQSLTQKKAVLTKNIASYKSIIAQCKKAISSHSTLQATAESHLKQLIATCKAQSFKYVKESAERAREIKILIKVQEHIQKKLAGMKSYLKKRINKF